MWDFVSKFSAALGFSYCYRNPQINIQVHGLKIIQMLYLCMPFSHTEITSLTRLIYEKLDSY